MKQGSQQYQQVTGTIQVVITALDTTVTGGLQLNGPQHQRGIVTFIMVISLQTGVTVIKRAALTYGA